MDFPGQPTQSNSPNLSDGRRPIAPTTMSVRSTTHPSTSGGPRLQTSSIDDFSPSLASPTTVKASLPIAGSPNTRHPERKASADNYETVTNLNYRRLQELPEEIERRVELEKLSLAYNLLTSLPRFILKFQNLVSVNLRSNTFFEFPRVLCHLPNLAILDISRNRIRYLPKEPGKLLNLQMFNISKNQIVLLPSYFSKMARLEKLKLEANPFSQNNELFTKEKIQEKKDWPRNLFSYLKETEDAGKEGITFQFSRASMRANLKSGSNPGSPQRHHPKEVLRSAPSSKRTPAPKSRTTRSNSRPLATQDYHSESDSVGSSDEEENLETQRPSRIFISTKESPDSSPFPSPTENSCSFKKHVVPRKKSELDKCTSFFINPKSHLKETDIEKFKAFEKLLYCAYFLIERTDVWIEYSDNSEHIKDLREKLTSSVMFMTRLIGHTEFSWEEIETSGKKISAQLVAFTHAVQAILNSWRDAVSLPSLQSLSFVLLESTFHLKDACSSLKKAYAAKETPLDLPLSPSQEFFYTPASQALSQPMRSRPSSPLSQSSRSPSREKEPAYDVPEQNQLHLSAHMATSSAFKCIQLLGEPTLQHSPTLDTAIQMAEDSTHLLVSSLNLVASSPTAAPLPLCQRFVQDIFSFVKDIIHLTQSVRSHFLADSRLASIPPSLVAHLQTLTHTTKQLAGLLTNQQENASSKDSHTLEV